MFENRTDKETFVFPSNFCWPFPSHPQQTDLSVLCTFSEEFSACCSRRTD